MKKHILFLSSDLKIGGLERVLLEYLNNIDKDKYKITLFLMSDFGKEAVLKDEIRSDIEIRYIRTFDMIQKREELKKNKKRLFIKLKYNFYLLKEKIQNNKKFIKYFNELKDVDLIVDFDRSFINYKKYMRDIPVLIWIHASFVELDRVKEINIKKLGPKLEKYNKIVTICNEMKEEIVDLYPTLKNKVITVYNPFDYKRIIDMGDNYEEFTNIDYEIIKEDYFLSVSRLDNMQKDFFTLIKAFNIIVKKGRKEKLYIIGEGSGREEIELLIKKLNLENNVKLLGGKKNPYIWMKNAKLFIHSSKYEGFGLVLVEAMSLGTIVVSSDCPVGPKEILDNGKSGILFKTGDENELANNILDLLNNEKLIEALKNNTVKQIEKFSSKEILKSFNNLVENNIKENIL